jgi:N6-adenosine-specific RNA methylase IME4
MGCGRRGGATSHTISCDKKTVAHYSWRMGRPPLDPTTGPQTATQRSAKRYAHKRKSINRRRRTLYKIATESEIKKTKRAQREAILNGIAKRTAAATAALDSPAMPLCNIAYLDPPWPHDNYSPETGSDRSTDNIYPPMSWPELDAFGAKLPVAKDGMLIVWVPKSVIVRASLMLKEWGWDPLRATSMAWFKTQANHPDKLWLGTGKRLRDQHESIIIAVRGAVPPALPMWNSVLVAPIGEASEKPKLLAEMIDRDYAPALTRIEMFARPPFERRGWFYWGDAVPDGLMSCRDERPY